MMTALFLQAEFEAGAGVELVAEGVAKEVEAENGAGDCKRWEEHKVRRVEEMQTRIVDHRSPAGRGRRDA